MKIARHLYPAFTLTIALTVLLGLLYPLAVTGLAHLLFPREAEGSLIVSHGQVVGSRLIGQPFSSPGYFWSRPSAAGSGYDAMQSGGSNLAPTSRKLIAEQVGVAAAAALAAAGDREPSPAPATATSAGPGGRRPRRTVPVDLVTSSGSGLDPHITPAAAAFQAGRVARERGMPEDVVRQLVARHTEGRQLGFLGEPRVNVLELNLDLDAMRPLPSRTPPFDS